MSYSNSNEAVSTSPASLWQLSRPPPGSESVTSSDNVNEVALDDDNRREVPYPERQPGTQYYSVARLTMYFQSKTCSGTGFMISEETMATAGHCVFDWKRNEPAYSLIARFGYYDAYDTWHEERSGLEVVMSNTEGENRDVAFVRLAARQSAAATYPIVPFTIVNCPPTWSSWLFIPGYPGDKGYHGKRMYEGSGYVSWDLSRDGGVLAHRISTFEGQSGSPILLTDRKTAIAVHISGNQKLGTNYGCPVGALGVILGPYISVLDGQRFTLAEPNAQFQGGVWVRKINVWFYAGDYSS